MVESLIAAWGQWPLFVGLAVALIVRVWQVASLSPALAPELDALVWSRVPSRVRPLVPLLGAGLVAGSSALIAGASWAGAADAALLAWGAALGGAESLRLTLGKVAP